MTPTHVLLLCGGGSTEHDVSLLSANYIHAELNKIPHLHVYRVEIDRNGTWLNPQGEICQLNLNKQLRMGEQQVHIDYVIPCIHGFPGETGDIQSLLTLAKLPYLGCDASASTVCFNKISSKLWFDALEIPNTPYLFLSDDSDESMIKAEKAFEQWQGLFVKAACQGSSVGCYQVTEQSQVRESIKKAFQYSDQVLVEQSLVPRELEIAVYQFGDEIIVTPPAEICCPEGTFYTFDEKYSQESHSSTTLTPRNLSEAQIQQMQVWAKKAFVQMKLKDLSRIDFFMTESGEILLNEINTFPGMTPISMFPKLLQAQGHNFSKFLADRIRQTQNA